MTQEIVITTSTRTAPVKDAFSSFDLGDDLLRAVSEAGFTTPRPIQQQTIEQVLDGRDVMGLAQTGTGKTAAFGLPILEILAAGKRGQGPRALIISPTRELALQTCAEIEVLAKYTKLRVQPIFGGVGLNPQVRALKAGPDIIVACPGRLLDLSNQGHVRFGDIEVLVLDEADHMLDMGFLPDIKRILSKLPKKRQNLLFSATMPKEIRGLANSLLNKPHVVELAHSAPAETIEHALYPVEQKRKTALLHHLLGADDFRSAIVFLRTKHRARRLARELDRKGHNAIALQGNMSQNQRQKAMQGFRDGKYDVLVATDIAARGIDVAQVSHVINYDIPNTPDAYTHRIGRTGRAERSGKAYTFVTHEDNAGVKAIERKINAKIPRVKLTDFGGEDAGSDEFARDPRPFRGSHARSGRPASGGGRGGGRGSRGPRGKAAGSGRSEGASKPKTSGSKTRKNAAAPKAAPSSASKAAPKASGSSDGFGAGVDSRGPAAKKSSSSLSKNAKRRRRVRELNSAKSSGRDKASQSFGAGAGRSRSKRSAN